jgi:hypothetical protein
MKRSIGFCVSLVLGGLVAAGCTRTDGRVSDRPTVPAAVAPPDSSESPPSPAP